MSGNGLGGGLFVDAMGGWGGAALLVSLALILILTFFSIFGYCDFIIFFFIKDDSFVLLRLFFSCPELGLSVKCGRNDRNLGLTFVQADRRKVTGHPVACS